MNYIFFLLSDTFDGNFHIQAYISDVYSDLVYSFTDKQLELLYKLLEPYRVDADSYNYLGVHGITELVLCPTAEEVLRFLSWRNN